MGLVVGGAELNLSAIDKHLNRMYLAQAHKELKVK
jgi:hypothetical protein